MFSNLLKSKIALFIIILIIFIFISFTKKDSNSTIYQNVTKDYLYLLNQDDYLVRTTLYISNSNELDILKEKISYLIIDSYNTNLISNDYEPIIPNGTKIIDLSIDNDIVKINFSQEFLNISSKYEEALIESIIFTITEDNKYNKVMIFVDGNLLEKLPNSHKSIPQILTREYGINKYYHLNDYKNVSKTIVYYNYNNDYLPVTFINNNQDEKIEIIINELKSSTFNQTNLISYLKANAILEQYEILENAINLSFNQYIFDDFTNKVISEEVKYTIYLSIKDNYHIKEVNYLYHDELISKVDKL